MTSMLETHLSFMDRLRVLFGATIYLRTRVWFVKHEPPFDAPVPLVAHHVSVSLRRGLKQERLISTKGVCE